MRYMCVHRARLLERAGVSFGITDFFNLADQPIVIKSVDSPGRAGLYTETCNSKTVIILRHPCGQIASQLRGFRNRKLPWESLKWPLLGPVSSQYGLDRLAWGELNSLENLSRKWVITNETALRHCPYAFLVRHEDVCDRLVELAREIMAFAGLEWSEQTLEFLESSTDPGGDDYFSVFRDAQAEANEWRGELRDEVIR